MSADQYVSEGLCWREASWTQMWKVIKQEETKRAHAFRMYIDRALLCCHFTGDWDHALDCISITHCLPENPSVLYPMIYEATF